MKNEPILLIYDPPPEATILEKQKMSQYNLPCYSYDYANSYKKASK